MATVIIAEQEVKVTTDSANYTNENEMKNSCVIGLIRVIHGCYSRWVINPIHFTTFLETNSSFVGLVRLSEFFQKNSQRFPDYMSRYK